MTDDPGFSSSPLDRLIQNLNRLPGIGSKSAERLAHHLLKCPVEEALALAEAIRNARAQIHHCRVCHNLSEADQSLCPICRDPKRDTSTICVVESARDLIALENARTFQGVYHVLLGRLAPLQGIGPDQLTLASLIDRVRQGGVSEVILATNPNLEGDGTALLVAGQIEKLGVTITRLARGLASGGSLEFANKEMLADAISGRRPL